MGAAQNHTSDLQTLPKSQQISSSEWGGDINLPNKELATPQDYATGACAELLQQLGN